jgi:alpha-D-xyloside xylohydrolase
MRRAAVLLSLLVVAGCDSPPPQPPWDPAQPPGSAFMLTPDTRPTAPGCPALSVALRPNDDDGARYHRPERPDEELEWLHARNVLISAPGVAQKALFELVDDSGAVRATAGVRRGPGRDGFEHIDIEVGLRDIDVAMLSVCWSLGADEHVVGGGERFTGVDLRGTTVPLAFNLGGFTSGTNEAHAPVPFLATSGGFGLYVESERPGAFDVGDSDERRLVARFHGNSLRLRVREGTIEGNVAAFARHVGLPPRPPLWVLAPQQWRNEHSVTVENDVVTVTGRDRALDDARIMRERGIPNTALWIDAPWSTGHNTFQWNEVQFPEPQAMIDELERQGFRVIVWATEHLNRSDDQDQMYGMPAYGSLDLFNQFADEGWLVPTPTGGTFTFPWGRGDGGYVDFTNPDAVAAFQELMRPLVRMGVRGFKLDYGEVMRPELLGLTNTTVAFADGSTTETMHTRYARLYHEAYLEVLQQEHPDDHYIITRTGGLYDQRNGVTIWPGDLDNDWLAAGEADPDEDDDPAVGGLPAAIQGGLSLSMSGYPLYGSDIGGYRGGTPTPEVLIRWMQFGAVSTVMQLGGAGSHNPWDADNFPPETVDVYKRYADLHMDLLFFFERLVERASVNGEPPLVPLGVHMRDDAGGWEDRHTFLLGRDLLAAPVVEEGATTRLVRVPDGEWIGWWDDVVQVGPTSVSIDAPLEVLPLFQRVQTPVILAHPDLVTAVPADDPAIGDIESHGALRRVRVAAGVDNVAYGVGLRASATTSGDAVEVSTTSDDARPWAVELRLRADGVGPARDAAVRVDGDAPSEVEDETALWACDAACVLREDARVLVHAPVPATERSFEVGG